MNSQINNQSLKHVRGKFEIISTLLIIAQQPVTLSQLMSHIGLSSVSLKQYLKLMFDSGLISNHTIIRSKKKRNYPAYHATKKGNRFLELYFTNLLLLYEDNLPQESLEDRHLFQYYMNNKTTLMSNLPTIFELEINRF